MITIPFKLKTPFTNIKLLKQFNNVVHFAFNRYVDGMTKDSDVIKCVKSTMNNIELLDASFIDWAVNKAKSLWKASKELGNDKVIFGGKNNWIRFKTGKIKRQEFNKKRLLPLLAVGSHNDRGNRKFGLDLKNNRIIFKKSKTEHYDLEFYELSKSQKRLLDKLQDLYDKDKTLTCFTVELSEDYVYLTFDESEISEQTFIPKKGRTASIDMNPNYVALVIQDENGVILLEEIFNVKHLNDIDSPKCYENKEDKQTWRSHLNNKLKHEVLQVSKRMIELCIHYKVETFVVEDLKFKQQKQTKENKNSKKFNQLCLNKWHRRLLKDNLQKHCNLNQIEFKAVPAWYSSIKGQLENDDKIDSIAAAIEIGQRKDDVKKNYGSSVVEMGRLSTRWKNEIASNLNHPLWDQVAKYLQKNYPNQSYRVLFSEKNKNIRVSYSLESAKSYVKVYAFT